MIKRADPPRRIDFLVHRPGMSPPADDTLIVSIDGKYGRGGEFDHQNMPPPSATLLDGPQAANMCDAACQTTRGYFAAKKAALGEEGAAIGVEEGYKESKKAAMEEMEESTPAIVVSNLNFGYDKERNVLEQVRTTPPHSTPLVGFDALPYSPPLVSRPPLLTTLGPTPSPTHCPCSHALPYSPPLVPRPPLLTTLAPTPSPTHRPWSHALPYSPPLVRHGR